MDAATRNPIEVQALMNATANFATQTIAFSTTGTLTAPFTAPGANFHTNSGPTPTTPVANPGLDMTGTLSYAAGNNTFTGTVTTSNGVSGNATGRFYGPGLAAATATKVAGAPPEIGGTFAVTGAAGAMQGAFGGK